MKVSEVIEVIKAHQRNQEDFSLQFDQQIYAQFLSGKNFEESLGNKSIVVYRLSKERMNQYFNRNNFSLVLHNKIPD